MLLHWIKAFRLRTLPLSLSTILMGSALAIYEGHFQLKICVATILTTLFLQILSNLANDYGDGIKGTDNSDRLGPERALQSGKISPKQMKVAIIIFALLSLISGLYLILFAVEFNNYYQFLFLLLGIGAIGAAIKYTVGTKAYGYSGLGDVFVFIFFGIVGVTGSYYLQTQHFNISIILPSIAIGCLSTAVLNLNNMRDISNDAKMNKNTIVVKIGLNAAKRYHFCLFLITYCSLLIFILCVPNLQLNLTLIAITGLIAVIHLFHIKRVLSAKTYQEFDPELKKIAISTLLLSLLWLLAIIYFS